MEKGRRSALDCSRLAAAGTLRSTCPAWLARAVTCSVATLGPRASGRGGQGSPRGDVEELEDGAGPLGGADGGYRGRRACETAAGPAGRCHVIVSSAAHAAAASASGLSEGFPAPLGLIPARLLRGPAGHPQAFATEAGPPPAEL